MKPFDLEAAKRGEPLVTRDGRPAKFIAHVPENLSTYKVYAQVKGFIYLPSYNENGSRFEDSTSGEDLFMARRKVTYWLNIYAAPYSPSCHPSKEEADRSAASYRIGEARPVEIEL